LIEKISQALSKRQGEGRRKEGRNEENDEYQYNKFG
jgi:hypothetical protein